MTSWMERKWTSNATRSPQSTYMAYSNKKGIASVKVDEYTFSLQDKLRTVTISAPTSGDVVGFCMDDSLDVKGLYKSARENWWEDLFPERKALLNFCALVFKRTDSSKDPSAFSDVVRQEHQRVLDELKTEELVGPQQDQVPTTWDKETHYRSKQILARRQRAISDFERILRTTADITSLRQAATAFATSGLTDSMRLELSSYFDKDDRDATWAKTEEDADLIISALTNCLKGRGSWRDRMTRFLHRDVSPKPQ